jgi:hypothetical protein
MTIKTTACGPDGLRLELDGGDPDTPAMVYLKTPEVRPARLSSARMKAVCSLRLTARSSS